MAGSQSPGYPQFALPKAIAGVRKIFAADRRSVIDREVAQKHIGYSGQSGAADKALASLLHFGLLEKAGKGQVRVTQNAVDIIHPENDGARRRALADAAFRPQIYKDLRDRFGDHVSETALHSYLVRENFLDRAIGPVSNGYLETIRFLEQEKAFESGSPSAPTGGELDRQDNGEAGGDAGETVYGGAKVGDLIQWESQGSLQLEKPTRVRLVQTVEGIEYVAVEGYETGIPMDQVIVEERATELATPPTFKLPTVVEQARREGETEWMRNRVGRDTTVSLMVAGEMGPKEIGRLIKLLQAQKAVLDDEEEDDGDSAIQ